ncbi:hypothetical protein PAXINDRAFT_12465 [Paxillus involutus ATCC 200175]|uniref:G domain-containing protein n=1 Tax=Paxillus involutus ATCC 200175 TaxID=664439 RepID=A0A0C9TG58_PAXIN|nr:hypothetical protein PAXINDRAFT_12465 [Paxillus involutus ATCC 200175]
MVLNIFGRKKSSPVIVVCGHTGAGVSSIVNSIVGSNVAKVAPSRAGASTTIKAVHYPASFSGRNFEVYDMPGFDSLDVKGRDAIFPPSPNLVIICTQDNARKAKVTANHVKQHRRYDSVPVILVSLQHDQDQPQPQGNWWATTGNAAFGVMPNVRAREVVTMTGMDTTRTHLRTLISQNCTSP